MQTPTKADRYAGISPEQIRQLETEYLFATYKRYNLFASHGSGTYLFDVDGRKYLDLLAGIAVNSLGYAHPRIVRVISEQASRLIHCSNLLYHPYQGLLAQRLVKLSGLSKAFFTNSGTEAIEGALKISRAWAKRKGQPDKTVVLSLRDSFHGRTLGALSITAQEKYQAPFRPLLPSVRIVDELTPDALERAFGPDVCAVVVEPIQGEGGVVPLRADFVSRARALCDQYDALLVLDEIQCGMGRTGSWFAFQQLGVQPDIVTLAKAIASGYPLGVILGGPRVADVLQAGDHGTTFGGGPLACRLALEVLDVIEEEGLLAHVARTGAYLMAGLRKLAVSHPSIQDVRGQGLMVGAVLGVVARPTVDALLKNGVIANVAHDNVLRLLPPFVINIQDVDVFLQILDHVLAMIENSMSAGKGGA
jgi:acetylornithine/N-succinyldiaminopimelate aminotransferase